MEKLLRGISASVVIDMECMEIRLVLRDDLCVFKSKFEQNIAFSNIFLWLDDTAQTAEWFFFLKKLLSFSSLKNKFKKKF